MKSRAAVRAYIAPRLLVSALCGHKRARPTDVRRILIPQHLLLGDTLMLTPLLARVRERYPSADIVMTVPRALAPLYASRPYGVQAVAFDPRDVATVSALQQLAPFDIALLPADNRFSALARALGTRWIVGFDGDTPAYKNWWVDELKPFARAPMSFADLAARLIDDTAPRPYRPSDWPAPPVSAFTAPQGRYCVLHAGASNALKQWPASSWRAVAEALSAQGYEVVWSGGAGEERIVAEIDPAGRYCSLVGRLDLAQLWNLVARAQALVSVDTGVAHIGRLTYTPTVTLFGPGSPRVCGAGDFWRESPYRALTVADVPCRDQHVVFRRTIPGLQHCIRLYGECEDNVCLQRLPVTDVLAALRELGVDVAAQTKTECR